MRFSRFLPFLVLCALMLGLAVQLMHQKQAAAPADAALGRHVPDITLTGLSTQDTFSTAAFAGEPYLLNVFASWCAACVLEHETLAAFAATSDLPLYGIAWKDDKAKLSRWLEKHGNSYQAIGLDETGFAAMELGVTGAPETYLVDASGIIVAVYRGALSEDAVNTYLRPALQSLGNGAAL